MCLNAFKLPSGLRKRERERYVVSLPIHVFRFSTVLQNPHGHGISPLGMQTQLNLELYNGFIG